MSADEYQDDWDDPELPEWLRNFFRATHAPAVAAVREGLEAAGVVLGAGVPDLAGRPDLELLDTQLEALSGAAASLLALAETARGHLGLAAATKDGRPDALQ